MTTGRPFIVGVCGGSGSGKTTIVNMLCTHQQQSEILVIPMDHYYRDFSLLPSKERDAVNFDDPAAFDLDLLVLHIRSLKNGQSVQRPTYEFATHSRTKAFVELKAQRTVIIEGILSLHHPRLRELYDLSVFVDVPDDVRFIRRLTRDTKERGRTQQGVIDQYLTTVRPMHNQHVEPQRQHANIILSWLERSENAIKMLAKAMV